VPEDPELIDGPAFVDVAIESQRRLVARLDALLAAGELHVDAPSLLPDWTIGHVITHVTNSGDGHLRMLDAAARGEVGAQYPGGYDQRRSEIEAGAVLAAEQQVDALRRSCASLEARWATMPTWDGVGASMGGDVPVADLPYLRVREVAIHHIDLGIGDTFADLPDVYLREELRRMEMLWAARQPMGLTSLPVEALAVSPPERLAWLMGRTTIDGLDRAHVY
jgi:maleylpyruvate isomerase